MPQTMTGWCTDSVTKAMAKVPEISADEARSLFGSRDRVFPDLRDGTERARPGTIPGAVAFLRGMLEIHIDPESRADTPECKRDETYVLFRATGGRSAKAVLWAKAAGHSSMVNLSGGVGARQEAGCALE